jgi:hypothetical protein
MIAISSARSGRLFVVAPVERIIAGLDLREPLHAEGMNLSSAMSDGQAVNFLRRTRDTEAFLQE